MENLIKVTLARQNVIPCAVLGAALLALLFGFSQEASGKDPWHPDISSVRDDLREGDRRVNAINLLAGMVNLTDCNGESIDLPGGPCGFCPQPESPRSEAERECRQACVLLEEQKKPDVFLQILASTAPAPHAGYWALLNSACLASDRKAVELLTPKLREVVTKELPFGRSLAIDALQAYGNSTEFLKDRLRSETDLFNIFKLTKMVSSEEAEQRMNDAVYSLLRSTEADRQGDAAYFVIRNQYGEPTKRVRFGKHVVQTMKILAVSTPTKYPDWRAAGLAQEAVESLEKPRAKVAYFIDEKVRLRGTVVKDKLKHDLCVLLEERIDVLPKYKRSYWDFPHYDVDRVVMGGQTTGIESIKEGDFVEVSGEMSPSDMPGRDPRIWIWYGSVAKLNK